MVASSKILTVTYGSFSCTLEGFDDPFTTLQKVAEYFRRLAAQDRHFGGQPQIPDTNTLKAIAEANVGGAGVSAEMEENGVILRQSEAEAEAEAEAEDTPVTMFRSSRNEQEDEEADEKIATAAAGIAAAGAAAVATKLQPGKRSVEETLAAIRKNVERAESEIVLSDEEDGDSVEDAEVLENEEEAAPEAIAPPAPVEEDETDAEEDAVAEASDDEEVAAEAEPSDTTADPSEPEEVDAEAEPEEALVDEAPAPEAVAEIDDTPEPAVEEVAEVETAAVEETADEVEAEAETDVEVEAEVEEEIAAEVEAETEAEVEAEIEAKSEVEEIAEAEEPSNDDLQRLRNAILAADTSGEDEEVAAALPEEFADQGPEILEAEVAETTAAEPAPQDEETVQETFEVEVEVEVAEEEFGGGSTLTREEEADLARALAEAVSEDTDEYEAEEATYEEPQAEGYSEDVVAAADRLVADIEAVSDEDDRRAERRARAAAMLDRTTDDTEDGTLDRLLETTRTKMDRPEQQRRLNALDQLKAAVAATEAENQLRAVRGRGDDREPAELTAFRRDLTDADKARPSGDRPGRPAIRPAQIAPASPLILVSEQRIDEADKRANPADDRREVAETDGNLALKTAPEDMPVPEIEEFVDEIQGIPADAFQTDSFPEFAERVGAFDMHDLLESAAAYTTIVEGHERFSRAEVMNKIAGLDHAEGYSKEQGLRAFGKLLREGKILRVQDGHFAIARSSRFSVASRDGQ